MPATFSRPTIIAATELITRVGHGAFALLALKFGLEKQIPTASAPNLSIKARTVGEFVLEEPAALLPTADGNKTRSAVLVEEAVKQYNPHYPSDADAVFRRALALDGYSLNVDANTSAVTLLPMVPLDLDLPAVEDEVHRRLKDLNFTEPLGHLDQAIDAHRQGNWASANAQLRAFFESLLLHIGRGFYGAAESIGFEACLTLLGQKDFLSVARNEWRTDGKDFTHGLYKRLHPQGAHAGLSDEDDSAFRLHVVLVTARSYLRRLP
ncbi:MAG: hypothetical protein K2Y42_20555 [Hyphomicrobium sp.]|jgi:hypothetical protein|uniref:hypothetical protein n=1 Tax=Hyphomicrobium sp. TaxID=82 RepID=UPI0025C0406B|nr:hypothetical protein [Hyphomicrobium sp.]MBX9865141.1 hypothetical protein [Hyphomicrobium sp.]